MDRLERAKAFLRKVADDETLERLREGPASAFESLTETPSASTGEALDATRSAAEKLLADKPLTVPEQFALEAIIIPGQRPAIDIVNNGDFEISMPLFAGFSGDPTLKSNIRTALASIGRVEVSGFPGLPYGGTGFVVGRDLLMTNRHVAELFTNGSGTRGLAFKPGMGAGIDFRQEVDHREPEPVAVRRVVMIHPYWDMALLETEGLGNHPALTLSAKPAEGDGGTLVAVVGYPAFDPRNPAEVQNQVFRGVYNVKRLLPGKVGHARTIASFGHEVAAATHDASTLGGNSGSAVFDPATRTVLGLHFAGLYLDANFFVPAAELARDDRVLKAGVKFGQDAAPDPVQTATWWAPVESAAPPAATQPLAPAGLTTSWTIPLEIRIEIGAISSVDHLARK